MRMVIYSRMNLEFVEYCINYDKVLIKVYYETRTQDIENGLTSIIKELPDFRHFKDFGPNI